MGRIPRLQAPGAIYHITARGNGRRRIVRDDVDRETFLDVAGAVIAAHEWTCFGFCLMTTHYHLLVQTPEPNLADGMQKLNHRYARTFNRRHAQRDHLFGRRYHAELVQTDEHLRETCRYIVLNPVRARICKRADEWPWSSYRATLGIAEPPAFLATNGLLALFDRRADAFRRFVEGGRRNPSAS
jgi:putative transposase